MFNALLKNSLALCLAAALAACGGGGSDDTTTPVTVSTTLSASGGTVSHPDGVTIKVPAGALAAAATITVTPTTTGAPPKLPQGSDTALAQSKVYELTPHDVTFSQPVTIRIPIDTSKGTPIVYVSDKSTGWYPHQISATGDGYVEIQRTEFSWLYVAVPQSDKALGPNAWNAGVLTLDVNARQGIAVGGNVCDGAKGVGALACAFYILEYGSPGVVDMEVLQGRQAQATFSVLALSEANGVPYCQVSKMSLEVLFLGQWWFLSQHSATAKTTTKNTSGGTASRSDFDATFTLPYPGTLDLRVRTVCDNEADMKTVDPRLGAGSWKLRLTVKPSYTVGGTVSGLPAGGSVKLALNGGTAQTVAANDAFTMGTPLAGGSNFTVTASDFPAGYSCTVSNGSGSIAAANVANVAVNCIPVPLYTVGGTVSGLPGGGSVRLALNGGAPQTVSANGSFALNPALANAASYTVTASNAPANYNCAVNNGNGAIAGANVSNVSVACSPAAAARTFSGDVMGLPNGGSVTLQLNGANGQTVTNTSGTDADFLPFSINGQVVPGTAYAVTVGSVSVPGGENYSCSVAGGSGTMADGDVSFITVLCAPTGPFTVGGTVSGLMTGPYPSAVLMLNSDPAQTTRVPLTGNGAFTAGNFAGGSAYFVSVDTAGTGYFCIAANANGFVRANVTNIEVSCGVSSGPPAPMAVKNRAASR